MRIPVLAASLVAIADLMVLTDIAEALPQCPRAQSCEEALQLCVGFRTRRGLSRSEQNCEASATQCRRTGIWRAQHMPSAIAGGCTVIVR
jgi:hypothetical protein